MTVRRALAAGAVAFLIVATANSGGYRYGISDQAFYIPALTIAADASYFPRDAVLFAPQMRWWLGDNLLAPIVAAAPEELPLLMIVLYAGGLVLLFAGVVFLGRGLGGSWWMVAAATALFTLRHRIAKTGANSLEGYMHPRMIAFALGLVALGFLVRKRLLVALCILAVAAVVHPTTALWFGAVWMVAAYAGLSRRSILNGLFMLVLLVPVWSIARHLMAAPRMDAEWLAVIGEKDYLFSHAWPAYAWVANLLYPVVIVLLYRQRRSLGVTARGEGPLVVALLSLVAGFLISVPLAAARIAPVVQLQVNRVFWLLDAVAILYVAWWLIDVVASRRGVQRLAVACVVLLACARGGYIMLDTGRSFITLAPSDAWSGMMHEIGYEPKDVLVLADPGHAWKYGTSVRVGAFRDTVLEQSKDAAMAMYDRQMAMRVLERSRSLADFENFTAAQYLAVGRRYGAGVLVLENTRSIDLPVLYKNDRFVLYDLR